MRPRDRFRARPSRFGPDSRQQGAALLRLIAYVHHPGVTRRPVALEREGSNRRGSPEPEIDVLIAAYKDWFSLEDLASAFSIDRRTAGSHLKRRGVATRGRMLTDEQIAEAIELYEHGWSLGRIAEEFSVYPQSIRYRLLRRGIAMRPGPRR